MKNTRKIVLNKIFVLVLSLVSIYSFAQATPPSPGGGGGAVGPGGRPNVPINMYEYILLVVAAVMIVGFYFYSKKTKKINTNI